MLMIEGNDRCSQYCVGNLFGFNQLGGGCLHRHFHRVDGGFGGHEINQSCKIKKQDRVCRQSVSVGMIESLNVS